MDKRGIFFVISLSITLFLTNLFFTWWDQEKNKEWYDQQRVLQEKKKEALQSDLAQRTLKKEDLGLIPYKDGYALLAQNYLVLFSSEEEIQADGKQWTRTASDLDNLSFYSPAGQTPSPLKIPALSPLGIYDVQLVTSKGEITLAEWRNSSLRFPGETIGKGAPRYPAVALVKSNGQWLPIGLYQPGSELIQLIDRPAFSSIFKLETPKASPASGDEQYYVLETPYQQLVFSSRGGALVEINLPFTNDETPLNPVREIAFDREFLEEHPRDVQFPNRGYFTPGSNPTASPQFHQKGKLGGYYPLIRRAIPTRGTTVKPQFYTFNIVSEYPEISELNYNVTYFDERKIVFEASQPHRRIIKTFTLSEEGEIVPYCLDVTIKIEGDSRNLWVTSGVPEVELLSGASSPTLKYRISKGGEGDVETLSLPTELLTISSTIPDWLCNSNGFFGMIMDPLRSQEAGMRAAYIPGQAVPSRLIALDSVSQKFQAADLPGYAMMLPLRTDQSQSHFRLYAGPFAGSVLQHVDQIFTNPETGYNPDYTASQTYHGYFAFISRPFAKFLLFLMNFFHSLTNSWGFSIFLLTVALRIMLYPLNTWSMRSMAMMQKLNPEMQSIRTRYKKDPKRMQLEMANLYRERGVNPFSGCLPLLIQMPFLFGMFDLLKSTFELRGASFIPGWIDNLAAPDVLFTWTQPLFLIGNSFHLLPILLGVVMFLQQKLMSPTNQAMTDEQKQQKVMMSYMMPVLFTVMFYNVPSGLNLYWLFSMLLGIPQQWWTNKTIANEPLPARKPKTK